MAINEGRITIIMVLFMTFFVFTGMPLNIANSKLIPYAFSMRRALQFYEKRNICVITTKNPNISYTSSSGSLPTRQVQMFDVVNGFIKHILGIYREVVSQVLPLSVIHVASIPHRLLAE